MHAPVNVVQSVRTTSVKFSRWLFPTIIIYSFSIVYQLWGYFWETAAESQYNGVYYLIVFFFVILFIVRLMLAAVGLFVPNEGWNVGPSELPGTFSVVWTPPPQKTAKRTSINNHPLSLPTLNTGGGLCVGDWAGAGHPRRGVGNLRPRL